MLEGVKLEFAGYLFREFTWELEQHPELVTDLRGVSLKEVEFLEFAGYDRLDLRFRGRIYRLHLTWQQNVPPRIERIHNEAQRQKLP